MSLSQDKINKVKSLVVERPHTTQEIASHLGVSYRTVNRYVDELIKLIPNIRVHTFRGGVRGGLKVVFWKSTEPVYESKPKQEILKKLMSHADKYEFSPFDVYQYVDPEHREAFWVGKKELYTSRGNEDINQLLLQTKQEYLSFSGNFSWVRTKEKKRRVIDTLKQLVKKKVSVRMLGRIDFQSAENVELLYEINRSLGFNAIDIRHIHQPLRGAIMDDHTLRLVEYISKKPPQKVIFYKITDREWVNFFRDVFWQYYERSIPAKKRFEDIRSVTKRKTS